MRIRFKHRMAVAVLSAAAVSSGFGVAALVGGPVALAGPSPDAHDPANGTLFVSPTGSPANGGASCTDAKYASIQAAVNDASPGNTVYVCAGSYNEQVTISTNHLTLTGAGSTSIIDPTTASPSTVADPDHGNKSTVTIIDVTAGTTDVAISNLVVDGSGVSPSFAGCGDNFVGIFYQTASGMVSSATVENIVLPTALQGCQDGIGIFVQAHSGTADVTLQGDTVNGYDKGGVVCRDQGSTCHLRSDQVTGTGGNGAGAENGVEVGFGAEADITQSQISGNNYTGSVNATEPQADYAAGVLLYDASGNTQVKDNTLTDNQIAIEVVHSDGQIEHNTMSETASGIANSVGVFAVPCDIYCSYFSLSGGSDKVAIHDNQISFPGSPVAGSTGIWAGDGAASSTGMVQVDVNSPQISGAENNVVLGPTATGHVDIH